MLDEWVLHCCCSQVINSDPRSVPSRHRYVNGAAAQAQAFNASRFTNRSPASGHGGTREAHLAYIRRAIGVPPRREEESRKPNAVSNDLCLYTVDHFTSSRSSSLDSPFGSPSAPPPPSLATVDFSGFSAAGSTTSALVWVPSSCATPSSSSSSSSQFALVSSLFFFRLRFFFALLVRDALGAVCAEDEADDGGTQPMMWPLGRALLSITTCRFVRKLLTSS